MTVKDSTGATTNVNNGPFSITLSLSAQGTTSGTVLSGTLNANTASGVVTFSNIYALSSGSFKLQASTSGMATASSNAFSITNFVIDILATPPSPSNYFNFQLDLTLIGSDSNNYILGATVTIAETTALGLAGTLSRSSSVSTGIASFTGLYFSKVGMASITVSTTGSAFTKVVSITINQSTFLLSFSSLVNNI